MVHTLDEEQVIEHARAVADLVASLDVSFNLTSRGDVQGLPLIEMSAADFLQRWTAGVPETFSLEGDTNTSRRASGMTAADWFPADL